MRAGKPRVHHRAIANPQGAARPPDAPPARTASRASSVAPNPATDPHAGEAIARSAAPAIKPPPPSVLSPHPQRLFFGKAPIAHYGKTPEGYPQSCPKAANTRPP